MAALTAADLQAKHDHLEGAPDPFPATPDSPVKARKKQGDATADLDLDSAFPTLASPGGNKPASNTVSGWGAGAPRIKSVAARPMVAESFTMEAPNLSSAGKDGRPTTLGEVMKQVMSKHQVKVEASTNQKTRQTTFALKSEFQIELDKAKRTLLALLSPVVTAVLDAPASTIASIIGAKGATLNHIRAQTGVKVDIPRRDLLAPPGTNGSTSGAASPVPTGDDDDEPTIPISITGPSSSVEDAKHLINQVIASKRSKTTQRVRDIPAHVLPFVKAQRAVFEAAAQGAELSLALNAQEREITVSGDREAAMRVIDAVKGTIESCQSSNTSLKISLPKRQHRLLVGKAVDEIVAQSNCAVVVASPDEPSDEITVWGKAEDLPSGLQAVMQKANSQHIHEFPLPGPIAVSRQLLSYMNHIGYAKQLSEAHSGVQVFLPSPTVAAKASVINLEIIGDKPVVDAAVRQVSELLGKLIGATKDVQADWLIHRILQGTKNSKKIAQFYDAQNVRVFFPPEHLEQSTILLVYDYASPTASLNPAEKAKHLEDVAKELSKMAKDAADVKSEYIPVEQKWHEAVVGHGGTTLNAIIGEEQTLSIKLGKDANHADGEDFILVRGQASEVDRAVKDINKIVQDAKDDVILSGYSTQFDIDREYVGRIVGAGGAGVNKIRDQLGVKLDFSDDSDEKVVGKKKKPAPQKTHVTITGRKENVEEAKKRILAQVDRLADETSEILKIPAQYHASLIGQSGKYAIRLEERYDVKITFPRQNEGGEGRTREPLKPDEVLVKGGKKGVSQAKSELLDALEFEKEANNVATFTVPTRAVARILGRGGATINEIKDKTGAQIDVDKGFDEFTNITLKGTKKDIADAKAEILEIVEQVGEETSDTVNIESKFHRTIIGAGGQGLKDLIVRCGGPSDPRQQAGLIRFPRQGEPSDEVLLRGEPKVVSKLKSELEKAAAALRDKVVLAVEVPAAQHRALIGRGGQHLNDLQTRTGTQVQFPGSRSYYSVGEAENANELADVDPANIVKVSGPKAACEKAIEELKASVKEVKPPKPVTAELSETVLVPLKYHHVISQQGNFFRSLRSSGVHVENPVVPTKSAVPTRPSTVDAPAARIDDEDDAAGADLQWQVIPNYQDAEEGDSEWTLKSRDQAALDRAKQRIEEAINNAATMSHVGFLTMPDRTMFPRIVGTKGANVQRLRDETGADITLSREDTTITIIGTEAALIHAKDEILKITSGSGRPGRGRGGRREE